MDLRTEFLINLRKPVSETQILTPEQASVKEKKNPFNRRKPWAGPGS